LDPISDEHISDARLAIGPNCLLNFEHQINFIRPTCIVKAIYILSEKVGGLINDQSREMGGSGTN